MTRQTYVGIFADAERFKDNFIANLVYQSCINELLIQSDHISRCLVVTSDNKDIADVLTADLHRCEAELEEKWQKASLLYEGVC